jgi:hypothetical protein
MRIKLLENLEILNKLYLKESVIEVEMERGKELLKNKKAIVERVPVERATIGNWEKR